MKTNQRYIKAFNYSFNDEIDDFINEWIAENKFVLISVSMVDTIQMLSGRGPAASSFSSGYVRVLVVYEKVEENEQT